MKETTTYGLLGFPLIHSFSRSFFTEKFKNEGIDAQYINFEIPDISELNNVLALHPTLRGLNVTIPYKQQVIPFLDEMSEEAQTIGAVNVIRITNAGGKPKLKGFNSDVVGFVESIRPLLASHHQKALVLGTGGASKAICCGLDKLGIKHIYVSRTPAEGMLSYDQLTSEILEEYTLIINCTPLGTYPKVDTCPPIPYDYLGPKHLLFDLVYNPNKTLFLQKGETQGAKIKNGLEMLHLQAIASWKFWNSEE